MDTLKQTFSYYSKTPWVGLLRAIEIEQVVKLRDLCVPPILDLGCGDGFVAKLAFGHPLDVGIDSDYMALKMAFSFGHYRAPINTDAKKLPFKDSTFRTVYSNCAMEHMDDLDSVLKEIGRVLMPRGVLMALVPSHKFLKPIGKLGKFFGPGVWDSYNRLHNHVNLLSPEQWHRRMRVHGFVIQRISSYGKTEIAEFVSNRDMFSKFHLVAHWPFLRLRHGGNLGRVISRLNNNSFQRLQHMLSRDHENDSEDDGYWLFIVGYRKPEIV
jgi:SAM-dependent methyltransferase